MTTEDPNRPSCLAWAFVLSGAFWLAAIVIGLVLVATWNRGLL